MSVDFDHFEGCFSSNYTSFAVFVDVVVAMACINIIDVVFVMM